jgi:uncharacterized protein (TIGR02453 family)
MFQCFGPKALPFLRGLAFHQTKEWFDEKRDTYERAVRTPMGDLVDDDDARFAEAKIPIKSDRSPRCFESSRTSGFRRARTLTRPSAAVAMMRTSVKNDPGAPYFHLSPEECFFGAGFHMPDPRQLSRLRTAAAKAFKQMTARLAAARLKLSDEEALKRAPARFRTRASVMARRLASRGPPAPLNSLQVSPDQTADKGSAGLRPAAGGRCRSLFRS